MTRNQKDILIAVCGLTPQIVTETLWSIYNRRPKVNISEIWILTTLPGKERCLEDLLSYKTGRFNAFCEEYGISKDRINFGPSNVIVLTGRSGEPIGDIRTGEDSHAVADQICEFIRKQTERPDVRLHCSVAGGRKTMGIFLSFALQLYGREQDLLYHVLVNEPFETHPDFFYKPKKDLTITGRDGRSLHTKDAVIELAEIPYVRLRGHLGEEIFSGRRSFTDLVKLAQRELEINRSPEPVILDQKRREIRINTISILLTPSQMALYSFLARRKTDHCALSALKACGGCTECYPLVNKDTWGMVFLAVLAETDRSEMKRAHIPKDTSSLMTLISKLNRTIISAMASERLAAPYVIRSVGGRWAKHYGIAIDKNRITYKK